MYWLCPISNVMLKKKKKQSLSLIYRSVYVHGLCLTSKTYSPQLFMLHPQSFLCHFLNQEPNKNNNLWLNDKSTLLITCKLLFVTHTWPWSHTRSILWPLWYMLANTNTKAVSFKDRWRLFRESIQKSFHIGELDINNYSNISLPTVSRCLSFQNQKWFWALEFFSERLWKLKSLFNIFAGEDFCIG